MDASEVVSWEDGDFPCALQPTVQAPGARERGISCWALSFTLLIKVKLQRSLLPSTLIHRHAVWGLFLPGKRRHIRTHR